MIAIVRAPIGVVEEGSGPSNAADDLDESSVVWASLGREELCLWRVRVSDCMDKQERKPLLSGS